jgi:hypothetical protein
VTRVREAAFRTQDLKPIDPMKLATVVTDIDKR